jgi:hypothetical protein
MTELERFKCVCRGQEPDYVPILGLPGAAGVSYGGAWGEIHRALLRTGMPEWVDDWNGWSPADPTDVGKVPTWSKYWGTASPIVVDIWPSEPAVGINTKRTTKDCYEIIEYETGAVTRQLVNNDNIYSMPEFLAYHVRDKASWEYYKKCTKPGSLWAKEKIDEACRPYSRHDRPLFVHTLSSWGALRNLMGPEAGCMILYDDPELAHEIIDWHAWLRRTYLFPLIERLKPEIIQINEDCCYNHGMLISPQHFEEFCGASYRELSEAALANSADMFIIDTDGNIMELVPILERYRVNALYPVEAKAGNDLLALRQRHPNFIFIGWIEKEVVNAASEHLIRDEIMSKVVPLLKFGRYFPNLDHTLQPLCTFKNLCKLMTLLHEVTRNPEGLYPKRGLVD